MRLDATEEADALRGVHERIAMRHRDAYQPRHAAERLVKATIRGAGMLLTSVDDGPEYLRAQVTSPGGTTAAAVHVLEERGFRALIEDAVRAAAARSREMGEG